MSTEIKIGKTSAYTAIVTPKGELTGYNALFEPSTKFDKKGVFNANILLPKEEGEKILALVKDVQKAQFREFKQKNDKLAEITAIKPYSTINEEGEEIIDEKGRYILKTKCSANIEEGVINNRIAVFDSRLHPLKVLPVGEGSIVRLKIKLSGYCVGGKVGVSIRLNAVQIIKYIPYEGESSSEGFDIEEGFEIDTEEEATKPQNNNEIDDEETPF